MWKYFLVNKDEQSAKLQLIYQNKKKAEKSPNNFVF